jgi:hypothetical protein
MHHHDTASISTQSAMYRSTPAHSIILAIRWRLPKRTTCLAGSADSHPRTSRCPKVGPKRISIIYPKHHQIYFPPILYSNSILYILNAHLSNIAPHPSHHPSQISKPTLFIAYTARPPTSQPSSLPLSFLLFPFPIFPISSPSHTKPLHSKPPPSRRRTLDASILCRRIQVRYGGYKFNSDKDKPMPIVP